MKTSKLFILIGIILTIISSSKPCYRSQNIEISDSIITIDVGGEIFKTQMNTLTKFPESRLAKFLNQQDQGMAPMEKLRNGAYFLDADPSYFKEILDYLRYGKIITQDSNLLVGVKELSHYLGLTELVKELESREDENFNLLSEMQFQWQTFVNFAKTIFESIRDLALAEALRKKKESVYLVFNWGTFDEIYFRYSKKIYRIFSYLSRHPRVRLM